MEQLPLAAFIPGYPTWAPTQLTDLGNTDGEGLRKLLKDNSASDEEATLLWRLRSECVLDRQAGTRKPPLNSVEAVEHYLRNTWIQPAPKQWLAIGLDAERQRVLRPTWRKDPATDQWTSRDKYVKARSWNVPVASELPDLPPGGTWLLIFGQGPWVLGEEGVADGLRLLATETPVCDVIFNQIQSRNSRILFSLREQTGATRADFGWRVVPFPDPDLAKEANLW